MDKGVPSIMRSKTQLILTVPPADSRAASRLGLPLAHTAYRVGGGPHLFRANMPVAVRGGLMVIDDAGFDGLGQALPFCHEVMPGALTGSSAPSVPGPSRYWGRLSPSWGS